MDLPSRLVLSLAAAHPGTNLEINFIAYEPGLPERIKPFMVPSAESNGIMGIHQASILLLEWSKGLEHVCNMFPGLIDEGENWHCQLDEGQRLTFGRLDTKSTKVQLRAGATNPRHIGGRFQFENVEVVTIQIEASIAM